MVAGQSSHSVYTIGDCDGYGRDGVIGGGIGDGGHGVYVGGSGNDDVYGFDDGEVFDDSACCFGGRVMTMMPWQILS